MNQKKYTPGTSHLGQEKEEEHWETLRSLLTQMPAVHQPSTTIASEPLLKRAADKNSIVIARSTAEHFPLPSAVPAAEHAEPEKKQEEPAQPIVHGNAAAAKAEPTAAKPASDVRTQSNMHKRLTDSWTRKISQRVASTFDDGRAARTSSSIRASSSSQYTRNQAEIAYNQQGKVDYVTYTFNAPSQKKRMRDR